MTGQSFELLNLQISIRLSVWSALNHLMLGILICVVSLGTLLAKVALFGVNCVHLFPVTAVFVALTLMCRADSGAAEGS